MQYIPLRTASEELEFFLERLLKGVSLSENEIHIKHCQLEKQNLLMYFHSSLLPQKLLKIKTLLDDINSKNVA